VCRAKIAAVRVGNAGDCHGVAPGSFVDVYLAEVPEEAAQKVVQRVAAANKVISIQSMKDFLTTVLQPDLADWTDTLREGPAFI